MLSPLPGPSSQAWTLSRLARAGPPEVLFSVFGFQSGRSRRAVKGTEQVTEWAPSRRTPLSAPSHHGQLSGQGKGFMESRRSLASRLHDLDGKERATFQWQKGQTLGENQSPIPPSWSLHCLKCGF